MKEYESKKNGIDELDESLLTAMEEFEKIYGENDVEPVEQITQDFAFMETPEKFMGVTQSDSVMQEEQNPVSESMVQNISVEPVIQKGIPEASRYSSYKRRKRMWIPVVSMLLVLGIGITCFVKRKDIKALFSPKEEKTEKTMAEIITTEEITTETMEEEKKEWFADKTMCVPEMTANTISLPSADLSVFTTAMQQEIDEVPMEDRIDPWALVTLQLDSVEGSINQTSPGIPEETQQLTSTYMVLVDADTNEIIAERDCEKIVPPASMTKILTVITARDYIDETTLDEKFTITAEMVNEAQASGLSAVGFLPGDEVTVRDLLYGTIVCSGADAAMGLAQYCAGSQEAFVEKMNENIEKMGLSDTAHFTNVVGKYDENLNCTMTDMASIISIAMQDDLLKDVMGTRIYHTDVKYPDLEMPDGMEISNWFIRRIEDKEMNGKVLGAKTGFVNQSGFCCASYYEANNGKHYICVTGNANSSWRAIYDHVSVYRSFTK